MENYCYKYWPKHQKKKNLLLYGETLKNENSLYILAMKNGPKIDQTNVYNWTKCPYFALTDSHIVITPENSLCIQIDYSRQVSNWEFNKKIISPIGLKYMIVFAK